MKITFIVQLWPSIPTGGHEVIYEYADILSQEGHEIVVVHPLWILPKDPKLVSKLKEVLRWAISKGHNPYFWNKLFMRIKPWLRLTFFAKHVPFETSSPRKADIRTVPTLAEKHIPSADAVFATSWRTAKWVADYGSDRGQKYYLIQGLEVGIMLNEDLWLAWKLPLKKIVISNWLKYEVNKTGEEVFACIPNGIDPKKFHLVTPIEERDPKRVAMLYHISPLKGSQDGIEALRTVKAKYPELKATLFGVYKYNKKIPPWIEFHQNPSKEKILEIYNNCSIFISPSWSEGWSLPCAEAMACGCALVSTKGGSVEEYAIHGKTALVSENKNPDELAQNIIRLIQDQELRLKLAKAGNEIVKQFTWQASARELAKVLSHK